MGRPDPETNAKPSDSRPRRFPVRAVLPAVRTAAAVLVFSLRVFPVAQAEASTPPPVSAQAEPVFDFAANAGEAASWVSLKAKSAEVRLRALDGSPPRVHEFSVFVPPDARLTFSLGAAGAARFIVEAEAGGRTARIFYEDVRPGEAGAYRAAGDERGPWRKRRVPLKAWGGRRVLLRFRTEALEEGAVAAHWGRPLLWAPAARPAKADNLVLALADSLSGPEREVPAPGVERLAREGFGFLRFYTNTVRSLEAALECLLASRSPAARAKSPPAETARPTLASVLAASGYDTAAFGLPGGDWGFDESSSYPGGGPAPAARDALRWLEERGSRPFFLLINLSDAGRPPLRFWLSSFVESLRGPRGLRAWERNARRGRSDEALEELWSALDALGFRENSLAAALSTRGAPSGAGSPPSGLSEDGIRAAWWMRHRKLAAGQVSTRPTQLLDAAPTFLHLLGTSIPGTFEGTVQTAAVPAVSARRRPRAAAQEELPSRILVHGESARALVLDGHYKYVSRRDAPAGLETEAVYDLWTDPGETRNLARRRRDLLARLRRVLAELDPEPVETRLSFWGLDAPVEGDVRLPAGEIIAPFSSGGLARRGGGEFAFSIEASSGEVRFVTRPPLAAHVLRVRLGGKPFPAERMLLSKFALPLLEKGAPEWSDRGLFPFLEGESGPRPGDQGPLMFWGRVPEAGTR
ncbi:MAG: hypothetical protein ACT4O3_01185 [Elusimicrobiota bacterium]